MFDIIRSDGTRGQVARFTWHFVQMALAMMVGMGVFAIALMLAGESDLEKRSPEMWGTSMGVAMAIPMAAWMRVRRHSWSRTLEMSAAMTVPIFALAAICAVGALPHTAVTGAAGVLMWAGMLGAMLYRRHEYTEHGHADREADGEPPSIEMTGVAETTSAMSDLVGSPR
jgi:hypothetical protein